MTHSKLSSDAQFLLLILWVFS